MLIFLVSQTVFLTLGGNITATWKNRAAVEVTHKKKTRLPGCLMCFTHFLCAAEDAMMLTALWVRARRLSGMLLVELARGATISLAEAAWPSNFPCRRFL